MRELAQLLGQWGCEGCAFVQRQLGAGMPCLVHAGSGSFGVVGFVAAGDASGGEAALPPTTDRPWPFTIREHARLLLLRGRIQDQRQPL